MAIFSAGKVPKKAWSKLLHVMYGIHDIFMQILYTARNLPDLGIFPQKDIDR